MDLAAPGIHLVTAVYAGRRLVQEVVFNSRRYSVAAARHWLLTRGFATGDFVAAGGDVRAPATRLQLQGVPRLEVLAAATARAPARVKLLAYTGVPMQLDNFAHPIVM